MLMTLVVKSDCSGLTSSTYPILYPSLFMAASWPAICCLADATSETMTPTVMSLGKCFL